MNVKVTQKILNVLIFLAVLALVLVVGYPQYKELQPSVVVIGIDKSLAGVPFYVAKIDTSRKYFDLEKVIPKFVEVDGDPLEALKRKEVDIAAVPWYRLILSPELSDGDTVKAIGALELKTVLDAVIIKKGSKRVKNYRDLSGKRLGYLANDEYLLNIILTKMEAQDGITRITKVPLTSGEIVNALNDDRADALFLLDPYRSFMITRGDTTLYEGLINRYAMPGFPYFAYAIRKGYLKADRRAAVRIKNVLDGVLGYLRIHPEIGKSSVIKANDWTGDAALMMNLRIPDYQRLIEIDIKHVEQLQTLMVQSGIGSCGIKPQEFLFTKEDFAKR